METLKAIAKSTENGKRTLAVMDESGIIKTVLCRNTDIDQVCAIEIYFDFNRLHEDEYLTEIIKSNGKLFYKMIDTDGESNWYKVIA